MTKKTSWSLGLALLLAISASAHAKGTGDPANLPQPVASWLTQAQQDCPSGFQSNGSVQSFDLTGDGKPSYVVDPHRLVCAGSPHLFVGDGPASIELFVTLPSGEVVHTGGVVALTYQVQPAPQGGAPVLAFQTHEVSERTGSIDAYRWDGRNFALLNKQSMAFPPVGGPDREYQ